MSHAPPPLDVNRHLLPFADGRCYDFMKQRIVQAGPAHFVSHRVPWTPKPMPQELLALVRGLVDDCMAVWHQKLWVEQNASLRARALNLKPRFPFLTVLLDLCLDNVDEALHLTAHLARSAAAVTNFREMLYIHGAGRTGKDTLILLQMEFLGSRSQGGLSVPLPPGFLLAQREESRNNATPFLDSLVGQRLAVIPETKRGQVDTDLMKVLCEQQGSEVASRACHGNANATKPSYLLLATSNRPPSLIHKDCDSGVQRRFNVVRLRRRVVAAPVEGAGEARARPGGKQGAMRVEGGGEMGWGVWDVRVGLWCLLGRVGGEGARDQGVGVGGVGGRQRVAGEGVEAPASDHTRVSERIRTRTPGSYYPNA